MTVTAEAYHRVLEQIKAMPEPEFESPEMMERVWGQNWQVTTEVGCLRKVLVHRPGDEMKIIDASMYKPEIGAIIEDNGMYYFRSDKAPDLELMQKQHDDLCNLLRKEGVEVIYLKNPGPKLVKSIYTRDLGCAVKGGVIVGRQGPLMRRGEEKPFVETLVSLGIPILRTVSGTGLFEGGSFAWINEKTAVVGESFRVNPEGVDQVQEILQRQGVELIRLPLVGYSLHIDGAFSMADVDLAVINVTKLPWWFIDRLGKMGIRTVQVDASDDSFTINFIAVKPGRIIMSHNSERTAEKLAAMGVEVLITDMSEITKNGGGIHCSTFPLLRDPA